jgi:SNF2 family DNA or RNA helicase
MQQFACLETEEQSNVYAPLNGFTAVDLGYQQGDAISNLINRIESTPQTSTYLNLFQQIWNDPTKLEDVSELICAHIESVYKENEPEKIYFLMLYNIFNEFLEDLNEDILPNELTGYKDTLVWNKLFNFQKDAATGIINKLEKFNGCILADSVGLGKTFTALAVIKYYELRNKSVLVLCPKKLADNWLTYNKNLKTNLFSRDRLNYDVLCHTDLQRTSGESYGIPLNRVNWGNYDLVVIDESHNFRNNDAYKERETRYQKLMNNVIRDGVKTKVLMLSATPVNNRFNDLRNQLALAYEGDSKNLENKLKTEKNVDDIFRKAQAVFNAWAELPPEQRTAKAILNALDFDFFEVLDSVTIARSRKHIEMFYDTKDIGRFPDRLKPKSFHSKLTTLDNVVGFNEIFDQLSLMKLVVYTPIKYIFPSRISKYEDLYDTDVKGGLGKLKQADREQSLKALMTVNLLKRLESSVEAFRITLSKLEAHYLGTLSKIKAYQELGKELDLTSVILDTDNLGPDEEPEIEDLSDASSIGTKIQIKLSDMDIPSWERDLSGDLELIQTLLMEMQKITVKKDAKLQHLKGFIKSKLEEPVNSGNRKVLLFTAFADTANYIYENIAKDFFNSHHIHSAKVTGSGSPKSTLEENYDFQSILTLFSPRSKEKELVMSDQPGEIDILIGTDCISEGQNLQDCDMVINYDIHWNPVRIIQRFGRIDRIGSPNKCIQLVNYWPDITLDEYINLKERVENRMIIADVTATGDDNPLNHEDNDVAYRKEQLRRLQDEVIDMEDLKTGVSITDLGLNDFRMDLLNYLKDADVLANLPNGMHAVLPANREMGLRAGVIFALKNINEKININLHNRLHPYYLVYLSDDGEVINNHIEVKKLLDLIRANCKGIDKPYLQACRGFNEDTEDGKNMQKYSLLLDKAIRSIVDVKEERDIDSLFTKGRTSALVDTIGGLDDFELVSFLVIKD